MPDKTGEWLQRIRQRTQTLRKRKEKTAMSCLTMVCLALFTCIGTLLHEVQSPGVLDVTGAFGAVLLHGGRVCTCRRAGIYGWGSGGSAGDPVRKRQTTFYEGKGR